jgi:hypothetical protein
VECHRRRSFRQCLIDDPWFQLKHGYGEYLRRSASPRIGTDVALAAALQTDRDDGWLSRLFIKQPKGKREVTNFPTP